MLSQALHGSHYSTVDAKGRVSVPTRLRNALIGSESTEIVLTLHRDPCVLVFPTAVWHGLIQSLRSTSVLDEDGGRRKRFLFANASGCPIDKQGRVLLPPPLRDFAEIGRDVIWLGVDDHAEIWDRAHWEAELKKARQDGARP